MSWDWIVFGGGTYAFGLLAVSIYVDQIVLALSDGKDRTAYVVLLSLLVTLLLSFLVARLVFDVKRWSRVRKDRRVNETQAVQNVGAAQERERAPGELARGAESQSASVVHAAEECPFLTHEGELRYNGGSAGTEGVQARDAEAEERLRAWLRANRTLGW